MATASDGLLGLLSRVAGGIEHVISSPLARGLGTAAAFGFNPFLGLLAVPGIKNERERRAAENELLRQEIRERKQRSEAQAGILGLLGQQTEVSAPVGLLNPNGGMDMLPASRRVPTIETPAGQQSLRGLLAQAAPESFSTAMIGNLFAQPQPTATQRDLIAAGIDPNSELGRSILLNKVMPQPGGLAAKFQTVEEALGRKLTDKEILGLSGGGTTINVGTDEGAKRIPPNQLENMRLPDGSTPPLGTTFDDAVQAGARVFSAADLNRQQQLEGALGVLTDLKKLQGQIDQSGVFSGVGSNVLARLANGVGNTIGTLFGTEGSEARTLFRDMSRGTIAPLVRSLGESGALAEGDVDRALSLLPDNGGLLPDSTSIANEKLKGLQEIFQRAADNLSGGRAGASSTGGGGTGASNAGGRRFRYNPATGQLEPAQ